MIRVIMLVVFVGMVFGVCGDGFADETASPQEVIAKVREAANFIAANGEAAIGEFNDRNGQWVWKDTYVFVFSCQEKKIVAHPIKPKLIGKNMTTLRDVSGKLFFLDLCNEAQKTSGGWVEYIWSKVGENKPSRKISYILQVPGKPYQVGAGIYNDTINIAELNKMIR